MNSRNEKNIGLKLEKEGGGFILHGLGKLRSIVPSFQLDVITEYWTPPFESVVSILTCTFSERNARRGHLGQWARWMGGEDICEDDNHDFNLGTCN